jgi:hypothetical protein
MSKRAARPYLEFPGTAVRIPVPDDPDQEDEVVAAAFDDLVAEGVLDGRDEPTTPAEDVYRELGITPAKRQSLTKRGRKAAVEAPLTGRLTFRVPKSVHRELVDRAKAEGISLSQLLLTYVSRGLGADDPATRAV